MNCPPDHLLHFTPDRYGGTWSLECLPHGDHFTADIEEWDCSAEELEANGVTVDRSTCWVHDWIGELEQEEWMKPGEWGKNGPWPVVCTYDCGLEVWAVRTTQDPDPASSPVLSVLPRGPRFDSPPKCVAFAWIGQPLTSCDRCSAPATEHTGWDRCRNPFSDEGRWIQLFEPYPTSENSDGP